MQTYRYDKKKSFDISKASTSTTGEFTCKEEAKQEFKENLSKITKLQRKLYAERKEGVIFIFQAMDAAGKDGVIRTVFEQLTPHGVKEYCFKAPTPEELSHDYLWRFWPALPARGNIAIFNRSYYEDVLVGKVHKLYNNLILPKRINRDTIISERYKQINQFEQYLYETGTRVVKIFLNVSKDEQANRFISRIDTKKKNWKISENDIKEREYWNEYQQAFEDMINRTSTKHCPWYVIPADNKWYERLLVSRIVLQTLEEMDPQYPKIPEEQQESIQAYRKELIDSIENEDLKAQYIEKSEPTIEEMNAILEALEEGEEEITVELVVWEKDENGEELPNFEKKPSEKKKSNKKKKKSSKKKEHKEEDSHPEDPFNMIPLEELLNELDADIDAVIQHDLKNPPVEGVYAIDSTPQVEGNEVDSSSVQEAEAAIEPEMIPENPRVDDNQEAIIDNQEDRQKE